MASDDQSLSPEAAHCVRSLLAQVQASVGAAAGFDADAWLYRWLHEPVPALGSQRPVDLLEDQAGRIQVATVLGRALAGSYS